MVVSGQFHTTVTLFLGKEPVMTLDQEAGWALELVWLFFRREKSVAAARNQTLDHPTHSLVAIRNVLWWFCIK
jgi:hypothetical protein